MRNLGQIDVLSDWLFEVIHDAVPSPTVVTIRIGLIALLYLLGNMQEHRR